MSRNLDVSYFFNSVLIAIFDQQEHEQTTRNVPKQKASFVYSAIAVEPSQIDERRGNSDEMAGTLHEIKLH